MKPNYYKAIIILRDGSAKKYNDIAKNRLDSFELWAVAKFPDAHHVNYYDHLRRFVSQRRFGESK